MTGFLEPLGPSIESGQALCRLCPTGRCGRSRNHRLLTHHKIGRRCWRTADGDISESKIVTILPCYNVNSPGLTPIGSLLWQAKQIMSALSNVHVIAVSPGKIASEYGKYLNDECPSPSECGTSFTRRFERWFIPLATPMRYWKIAASSTVAIVEFFSAKTG